MAGKVQGAPDLSIVVAVVSDAAHLRGSLTALFHQVDPPEMEVLIPYRASDRDIQALAPSFPEAIFHPVENLASPANFNGASREYHDELRAIGLGLAQGEIVALVEDHGRVDKYWSTKIVEAHRQPHVAIGGAIENKVDQSLNWAVYFCDFGRYQNPLAEGVVNHLSDANISYKRRFLDEIRESWQQSFHEPTVNGTLMNKGQTLWLSPDIVVFQERHDLQLGGALKERYVWGRSYAGTLAQEIPVVKRLFYLAFTPALPLLLAARKTRDVMKKKSCRLAYLRALPYTLLLLVFWSIGELVGYLTARPVSA